ncbi:hypothetical protein HID58_020339 [Brassica napus]|uniref:Uncharacterized protein n=1 Tax=Brassica napus TaxID=3708 RepID=A0ABQ7XJF7_BRANA|nr:hypothetical protein HID58_020339 [Brassica napus]
MVCKRRSQNDLKSGSKCSSVVKARLLRYWEARNVKRGGELMWVDMFLIDVNNYRLTDSPLLGLLEVRCCCEEQCYPVSKYETRQLETPFSEGGAGASIS